MADRKLRAVSQQEPKERLWPDPLDLRRLATEDPESPRFIIRDWLPCGYATLFAGHGGVGKSAIALYLAVCISLGRDFFGMPCEQRSVLYLACEDREGVLHWRLSRICRHLGVELDQLDHLHVLDLVGRDAILWEKDPRTGNAITPAFAELAERFSGVDVIMVDGVSDTFGGNENNRAEVKRYVNALVSLIDGDHGAVVLVGHIAKPQTSTSGEGYSGSTAWHNSVRARWYLFPQTERDEEGETRKTGELALELQKSNLGRTDREMRFSWDEDAHLFTGRLIGAKSATEKSIINRAEEDAIRKAIDACEKAGIMIPASMRGERTMKNVLEANPLFPDALRGLSRVKSKKFARHVENLRGMRHIEEYGFRRSDRKFVTAVRLTDIGKRAV